MLYILGGNGGVVGVATGTLILFAGTAGGVSKLNSSVVTSVGAPIIMERVTLL